MNIYIFLIMIPFSTGSQQGHNPQCYWWCSWEWSSKFYRNILFNVSITARGPNVPTKI